MIAKNPFEAFPTPPIGLEEDLEENEDAEGSYTGEESETPLVEPFDESLIGEESETPLVDHDDEASSVDDRELSSDTIDLGNPPLKPDAHRSRRISSRREKIPESIEGEYQEAVSERDYLRALDLLQDVASGDQLKTLEEQLLFTAAVSKQIPPAIADDLAQKGLLLVGEPNEQGGMSKVFIAQHIYEEGVGPAQKFILKFLVAPPASDRVGKASFDHLKSRFLGEVEVLRQLDSPHIVRLKDAHISESEGGLYYEMEQVKGESLKEKLEAGPLSVDDAVRYGTQIFSALEELHRLRIIHRDLKPGNIIIDEKQDAAKVIDFGLAANFEGRYSRLLILATELTRLSETAPGSLEEYNLLKKFPDADSSDTPRERVEHLLEMMREDNEIKELVNQFRAGEQPFETLSKLRTDHSRFYQNFYAAQTGLKLDRDFVADLNQTLFEQCIGTPLYWAPEQALSVHLLKSDVHAAGQILYEALTGVVPINSIEDSGQDKPTGRIQIIKAIMVKKSANVYARLVDLVRDGKHEPVKDLDLRLAVLVDWMMDTNPDTRPTATQARQELEAFSKGLPPGEALAERLAKAGV